jgi:hypothetical protein
MKLVRQLAVGTILAATVSLVACAHMGGLSKDRSRSPYDTAEMRLAAIRRAHVWAATEVASMDLMAGPSGPGAFPPNATVTCDYVDKKMGGRSPKFTCVIPPGDELKVKFGPDNGEVYAEVAASRLFWALGFGADRMYPVRVVCRGCPSNIQGTDIASIQRKMRGREIETATGSGWAWPELDLVDPTTDGTLRAERDALKLLAVFIQHTDSKPEQQRLICVSTPEKPQDGAPCAEAFMMVHDLGLTFGHANLFNRNSVGSVNLRGWSHTPVWKDPARCVANLPKSLTGSLNNPSITEAGRQFLADLLVQLTDTQLHDLFDVARVTYRSTATNRSSGGTSIEQWVDTFKQKRNEIANHTCP